MGETPISENTGPNRGERIKPLDYNENPAPGKSNNGVIVVIRRAFVNPHPAISSRKLASLGVR